MTGPNPAFTVYIFNMTSSASPNDSVAEEIPLDVPSGFTRDG
jgi:hypothetical protein